MTDARTQAIATKRNLLNIKRELEAAIERHIRLGEVAANCGETEIGKEIELQIGRMKVLLADTNQRIEGVGYSYGIARDCVAILGLHPIAPAPIL